MKRILAATALSLALGLAAAPPVHAYERDGRPPAVCSTASALTSSYQRQSHQRLNHLRRRV